MCHIKNCQNPLWHCRSAVFVTCDFDMTTRDAEKTIAWIQAMSPLDLTQAFFKGGNKLRRNWIYASVDWSPAPFLLLHSVKLYKTCEMSHGLVLK